MGRKKKFIDKKKAATFQLVARDSSDPNFDETTPGKDRVFVRVDNNSYSFDTLDDKYNDSNSRFDYARHDDDDEGDFNMAAGPAPAREFNLPVGTVPLPEHIRREILELGFPDDGYNYLAHLREIKNTGGGSAFYQNPKFKLDQVSRDIKAYDASRVHISEVKNESNEKWIYSVSSKTVSVKVQRAVDPEVAALLDDSDLSQFGSDVEDLEEDFIIQANRPEECVNIEIDEKMNLFEESKVVHEVINDDLYLHLGKGDIAAQDAENDDVADKPRVCRLLDKQFDLLECQEYGTDSDDDYDADLVREEESLTDKLKHVLKDHVADELESDDKYNVPAEDVVRRCVEYAEKYEIENEDVVTVVQESSDESEEWDCETIISTYSNLDNHPGKIQASDFTREKKLAETVSGALNVTNHVISLKGKKKLPVDFLPRSHRVTAEKMKSVGDHKTEPQKRKQHGQESKEEKKERKAAVKEERREARRAKKEMKGLYRCEAQRAQKVAAITGPSSIHLV